MAQDLLTRLRSQFVELVDAVRGYPDLSDEEISKRIDPDGWGIRNRDLYPDPFPRDGTFQLPGEFALKSSIAEGFDGLMPGQASLGHRLSLIQRGLELGVKYGSPAVSEQVFGVLVDTLRQLDEEWETIVPMESLQLKVPLLDVGLVRFYPTAENDDFAKWRAQAIRENLKDYPFLADFGESRGSPPAWLDTLSPNVKSYARVVTKGDSLLAAERALEMISEAIHVLRVFLARSETTRPRGGANFGLVGHGGVMRLEYGQRILLRKGAPVEAPAEVFSVTETSYVGAAARFMVTVDEGTLMWMNARGFGLLSAALAKARDTRTDLEGRLIRGAAWYSQGVSSRDGIDRFLKFVIALDALLGGRATEDGGTQVAERLAFLLSREAEGRKAVKKRAKAYFNKRGPLAHGSRTDVASDILFSLETDVWLAIQQFALDHIHRETFQAFLEWVEEQKFTTP